MGLEVAVEDAPRPQPLERRRELQQRERNPGVAAVAYPWIDEGDRPPRHGARPSSVRAPAFRMHLEAQLNLVVSRALRAVRRRVARPLLHGIRRPLVLRRIARASEVHVLGHRLRTEPGVFHPVYFSSSRVLAEAVVARAPGGRDVLDMGTGSGVIAVSAAAVGARVTACDRNPAAVALARVNTALNGLDVEVLESDLFAALPGRLFDLVAFNIPFYPHEPRTHFEAAFRAGHGFETVHRFADGAREHLRDGGRVLVVFSEDCGRDETLRVFTERGFAVEDEKVTRRALELFHVVSFRDDARAGPPRP